MNDVQDFISLRKAKTGVDICEACGGVIWDIDGERLCGDCKEKVAMLKTDWTKVEHFNAKEKWGDADKMNPLLIYSLDALRKIAGRRIIINSGYRPNDPGSTHRNGDAADIVITGLSVIDQFLLAEKTRLFSGIGVYPFWNRPGLHLDVRPLRANQHGPRWGRNAAGVYVALDAKFLIECM